MIAAEKFNQFKINGPPKAYVLLPDNDGNYNLNLDANYYVVVLNARSSSSTSR